MQADAIAFAAEATAIASVAAIAKKITVAATATTYGDGAAAFIGVSIVTVFKVRFDKLAHYTCPISSDLALDRQAALHSTEP
jgi:hypothetical protein